jgi:hypothetical protein
MTIDQMSEIEEWLSPLDDYSAFECVLEAVDRDCAEANIKWQGDWICDLYFSIKDSKISVENPAESHTSLAYTSVWEQICLRCL